MKLENIPASYKILLKMFYWMKLLQFEKIGGNSKHLELENQLDIRSKNLSNWIMIDFSTEIPNITQSSQWKKIKLEASWTCWISPWTGIFPGALERCRMVEMVPYGLQRTVSHSRSHPAQHISRNTLGKQPVIPLPSPGLLLQEASQYLPASAVASSTSQSPWWQFLPFVFLSN